MISERDYNNILNTAHDSGYEKGREEGRKEGREEGIEIGFEKGIEKGKFETAKKFNASGISDEIIASCTGLTLNQVKAL